MTIQISANPNVDIATTDQTSAQGQNSFSFSEIADLTVAEKAPEKKEVKKEEAPAKKKEELTDTKEMAAKKEDVPAQKPKAEIDNLDKAVKENEKEAKATEKAIKKLVAKYGEDILELHPDTKFTHKVDGKEEEVTLRELLNDKSGERAWDRRFQELDHDKKQWQAKTQKIDKFVTDFFNKAMTPGKSLEAFEMLAEATNQDPIEFVTNLRNSILQENQKYINMTEEERRLFDIQQKTDFYNRQLQAKATQYQQEQAMDLAQKELNAFQEKYELGPERSNEIFEILVKAGRDPQTMSVSDLEAYHVNDIAYSKAESAVGKLKADWLTNDDIVNVVANFVKKDLSVTPEAVENYVMTVFGIKPPKGTVQILQEKDPVQKTVVNEIKQPSGKKSPMFFHDLD